MATLFLHGVKVATAPPTNPATPYIALLEGAGAAFSMNGAAASLSSSSSGAVLVIVAGDVNVVPTGGLLCIGASADQQLPGTVAAVNADTTLIPGATVQVDSDPIVMGTNVLIDVPQDSVLWTDAPRAPQIVPTLLWITA